MAGVPRGWGRCVGAPRVAPALPPAPSSWHPAPLASPHPRVLSAAAGINYASPERGGRSPGRAAQHVLGRAPVTLRDPFGTHCAVGRASSLGNPLPSLEHPIAPP